MARSMVQLKLLQHLAAEVLFYLAPNSAARGRGGKETSTTKQMTLSKAGLLPSDRDKGRREHPALQSCPDWGFARTRDPENRPPRCRIPL